MESYRAGIGFAGAKANLESLNRLDTVTCLVSPHKTSSHLTKLHRSPGKLPSMQAFTALSC